jgi:hypothetical protein
MQLGMAIGFGFSQTKPNQTKPRQISSQFYATGLVLGKAKKNQTKMEKPNQAMEKINSELLAD